MKFNTSACVAALVVGSSILASGASIMTTADLEFVVGSGENLSVLVFDFQNESQSNFAWGYRYDGDASGEDMLIAVSAADPNLSIDNIAFIQEVSYFDGLTTNSQTGGSDTFWSLSVAGGFAGDDDLSNGMVDTPTPILGAGVTYPSVLTPSPVGSAAVSFGESGRLLADGSWDVWTFSSFSFPNGVFTVDTVPSAIAPIAAAAVPEPAVTGLLGALFLFWGIRRKR